MIHEFVNPVPVIVEVNKKGYAIYVRDGSTWENDIWCIVHCDGGIIRHYRSNQVLVDKNATFNIEPLNEKVKEANRKLQKKPK